MRLAYRPATPDDVPWLIDLRMVTMAEYIAASGQELSEDDHRARVLTDFEHIRVIELDGAAVGMIKVVRKPDAWQLVQVQVQPDQQGRGIGAKVVGELVTDARGAGVPVTLSVLKVNPAKRLYERLGFSVVCEKPRSFEMTT